MTKCEDCKNAIIYEDQSEDMRPPSCICKLGIDVKSIDIMEFIREDEKDCPEFIEGECEWA